MFGFWLPIGLLIASMILFATAIAKRRKRLSAETYRLTVVIWSVAVVTLGLGFGWSSYQMGQTLTRFESVKARANLLQNHIKAIEAQRQLMYFADPLQEADPIAQQKYREVLRNKAQSISSESTALKQEMTSAHSQFEKLNRARMHRDRILFLCVVVFASALTMGAIYRDAIRRRGIDKRLARA
jgi:hypothetical protein